MIRTKLLNLSIIILVLTSCSHSNSIELKDNVHLKTDDGQTFELIFDKGQEEEWIYTNVDSLSTATDYYGFLFYGITKNETEKKWFYVAGAPLEFKKGFGNWYDSEFRKYRLKEMTNGKYLYQKLKSTKEIWKEHN